MNSFPMQNKLIAGAILVGALAVLALLAVQFTEQWSWFDFALASVVLLGTAAALWVTTKAVRKIEHKALAGAAVLLVLFLVWVELGVGLVGSPLAGS